MKRLKKKISLGFGLALLSYFLCFDAAAQVTVGMDNPPAKAALLEIKSEESVPSAVNHNSNITSKKGGLGLPRVMLQNKKTLQPFLPAGTGTEFDSNTGKIKEKHAGLMVYNIYVSPKTETDSDKKFKQGVYVWDGAKWTLVGEGSGEKYFYIPSFNIKLDPAKVGSTDKVDLYAEYVKQFTDDSSTNLSSLFVTNSDSQVKDATVPSPEIGTLYTRAELDYVITYYDKNVIDELSILNAASGGNERGTLLFKVKSTDTTPNSFMNVVFVIKE